jgi:hypothetical protein
MESNELAVYADREEVRELKDRLIMLLPGVKECGEAGALALAQVALSMDLNPFLGEVWLIPQKGGSYTVMAGVKGIRRAARRQARQQGGHYSPPRFRLPTEIELAGAKLGDGDIAVACDVDIWTADATRVFELTAEKTTVSGLGIFRKGERTKMEPVQAARKRAETDAIKMAFDLPFGAADPVLEDPRDTALPAQWEVHPEGPMFKSSRMIGQAPEQSRGELPIETAPAVDEEGLWLASVVERVPYFKHERHVSNALVKLVEAGELEDGASKDEAFEALEVYARRRADEKAAEDESVSPRSAVQETIDF